MLRIGEFARLGEVSIKRLRYYDEIGLLRPAYVDKATGYRYYEPRQLVRLNRILLYRALGFSLDQTATVLRDDLPVAQLRDLLWMKRAELARRVRMEEGRLAQLEARLRQIEKDGCLPPYEIQQKEVGPRWVASVRAPLSQYAESEQLFGQLEQYLLSHDLRTELGAVWHRCLNDGGRIDCEAVAFLPESLPPAGTVRICELPSAEMACLLHAGGEDSSPAAYRALQDWIVKNGFQRAGPNREIYLSSAEAGLEITEIQIPIFGGDVGTTLQ